MFFEASCWIFTFDLNIKCLLVVKYPKTYQITPYLRYLLCVLCFSGANIWSGVTACDIVWYGDQILQRLSSTFPHEENTLTSLEDHTGDLFVS